MVFGTAMTLTIPTAKSNVVNTELSRIPIRSSITPRRVSGVQDQEESRDRGTVAGQPSEALLVEHTSKDDRAGQNMPGGMPSGECWCFW